MRTTTRRGKGEQGLAIIMTALALIPLMTFAAFGVDLASWYSRISQIQKAADAAALAGTVWMPNLNRATTEANANLLSNGFQDGVGGIEIVVERGATPTSLRVEITDTDADRVFSQVFRGQQSLTRHAEAEYNLPIPLGSPLNYFGGDASKTTQPTTFTYDPVWPTPWPPGSTWRPANFSCNVGLNGANTNAGLGRYDSSGNFVAGGHSGSTVCLWEVQTTTNTSTTNVPPASHFLSAPRDNPTQQCRVQSGNTGTYRGRFLSNGTWDVATAVGGSWNFNNGTGSNNWPRCSWGGSTTPPEPVLPTNRPCNINPPAGFMGRYTSNSSTAWSRTSSGSTTCSWTSTSTIVATSPLPPDYDTVAPSSSPRPCNVTGAPEHGSWASSGGHSLTVNVGWPKCRWPARFTVTDTTLPNPIDSTRNPGFWALIEGPGTAATQGDAYTPRCYLTANCGNVENASYRDTNNVDRGYWYVVKVPAGLSGSIDLQVFDAPGSTKVLTSFSAKTDYLAPRTLLVTEQQGDWLKALLPMRPNQSEGWIRLSDVTLSQNPYRITISLADHMVRMYKDGQEILSSPSVIGSDRTPTPLGNYYITDPVDLRS
ncbi:MAG: L,D-transpeptidase, partial [Acidimicrobiales bacterium]